MAEDRGDYEEAARILDLALARVEDRRGGGLAPLGLNYRGAVAWLLYRVGVVAWGSGQNDRAIKAWEDALALLRAEGHTWGIAATAGYLGLLAGATGDIARAAQLHRESLELRWAIGTMEDLAGCFVDIAVLASATGRPERAARLLGAEAAIRTALGAPARLPERVLYERAATEARRALGAVAFDSAFAAGRALPTPAAVAEAGEVVDETTAAEGLTPREIEVLRLLVEGRTSGDIGEALYISPRTAATHISNVLGKLGVESRAAAVAYAFQHKLV